MFQVGHNYDFEYGKTERAAWSPWLDSDDLGRVRFKGFAAAIIIGNQSRRSLIAATADPRQVTWQARADSGDPTLIVSTIMWAPPKIARRIVSAALKRIDSKNGRWCDVSVIEAGAILIEVAKVIKAPTFSHREMAEMQENAINRYLDDVSDEASRWDRDVE